MFDSSLLIAACCVHLSICFFVGISKDPFCSVYIVKYDERIQGLVFFIFFFSRLVKNF